MITITEIGDYLRKLRGNRSLREIERLSGVSNTYLSSLEKGVDPRTGSEIIPSPEILKKLAEPLGVHYVDLMKKAGHLPDRDYIAILRGLLEGISELTGGTFSEELVNRLEFLKLKYDLALEDDFQFTIENLEEVIKDSTWRQEWKQDFLIDILVQIKELGIDNSLNESMDKLEITELLLSNAQLLYRGRSLTVMDRQRILDMLKVLFPDE